MASVRPSHAPQSWRRFALRLAGRLDLPQDIVLDLPKTTLIGDLQLHVQNHRGVVEYTPRRIRINTAKGELAVLGARLSISSIYGRELVIEGRIAAVEYPDGHSARSPER
ncbi:MAG TPA: sporulation protein YqfC [Limnochordia bacterium]|nr:sporulation protein YqfC [Limnochordia bacterium]